MARHRVPRYQLITGRLRYRLLLGLWYLAAPLLASADTAETVLKQRDTQEQITVLEADIVATQIRLTEQSAARDALQASLRDTERLISQTDTQLSNLTVKRSALSQQIAALQREGTELQTQQAELEQAMAMGIQQLWLLHQGGGLRVWLGDEHPDDIARHLAYYQLVLTAQKDTVTRYEAGLKILENNASALQAAEREATQQTTAIAGLLEQLTTQQAQRGETIARLNDQLENDQQRLAVLAENKRNLDTLLAKLALAAPSAPIKRTPFSEATNSLAMPVNGKPSNRFGAKRNTDIRWQGWLIPAPQGEPVSAIFDGHIIFSDWLRGQGLIIVIDHGEGWLSLYAQNHSLLRGEGEFVRQGDIIAKVGASGGSERTGLYFEMRQKGKPIDPADWIQRSAPQR
jgi:septal ring factor EnvC (AmiA/AmiB activator)